MLEYIKGTLTESIATKITLEVGGLGYGLYISLSTYEKLPQIGAEIKVYTSTVIREDSHKMYGFLTKEEKALFEKLNDISGVGPRISLGILGHLTLEDLHMAIEHENGKALSAVPGIGKKMAQRLLLELRDKLPSIEKEMVAPKGESTISADAIQALITLGYSALEAQKKVSTVLKEQAEPSGLPELISLALKS